MDKHTPKPENPFVVGRYIDSHYFCDRIEETDFLIKSVGNGRDVAIISPRRLGKTGLIQNFFNHPAIKEKYITIFLDIYATSSLQEFVAALGHAVFQRIARLKESKWRNFIEIVKSIRPALSIDPVSGEPSLTLSPIRVDHPELTLSEIFTYLSDAPKKCVIAIDEFQQIANYENRNTEALLRSFIQKTPNAQFIYAGSEQSLMETIFCSSKKPFYQSCVIFRLFPIPEDKYIGFAMEMMEEYGKKGDVEVIRRVYKEMEGVTWFMQMMMNELFSITPEGGELNADAIDEAERNIIGVQEYSYREIMSRLSPRQRELAIYIAQKKEVENILSAETLAESGFKTAASVQSALKGLIKNGIVSTSGSTSDDRRRISLCDIFFSRWLRSR